MEHSENTDFDLKSAIRTWLDFPDKPRTNKPANSLQTKAESGREPSGINLSQSRIYPPCVVCSPIKPPLTSST